MTEMLVSRLKALQPTVNEICRVSGTAGASIGVLHHGKVIYTQGFGYRDVEEKSSPDQDTIYYLASMSKAVTALAVGMLVEDGKLQWDRPVVQYLKGFSQDDATVERESNIVDWLSHRTGLATRNQTWTAEFARPGMKREATLPVISSLEKINGFRERWVYNNWGWTLADHVIEQLSGTSWGSFLQSRIFEPLGMPRSTTDHCTTLDNIAQAHQTLASGVPVKKPRPFPADGKIMAGAVAVQSCVRDLLTLYQAMFEAAEDQQSRGSTSTPGSPLKQMNTLLSRHVDCYPDQSSPEYSYALGWIRAELPAKLGAVGLNPLLAGGMPVLGKGMEKSQLCLYHQGSNNTHLNSVHLLPDSQTAIVVLTNTLSNNDSADWLGELFLETILDNPDKNDYLSLAKRTAAESVNRWARMPGLLEEKRVPDTTMRPIDAYCGSYVNNIGTYSVNIFREGDKLQMCFQNNRSCPYHLRHYQYDTFSWLVSKDEAVGYARFPVTQPRFYLMTFGASQTDGDVDYLVWINDLDVDAGETFRRVEQDDARGAEDAKM